MSRGPGGPGLAQRVPAVGGSVGTPPSPGHPRGFGEDSWLLTAGWARPSPLHGDIEQGLISIS